ncbi:DUF6024 family protein [Tatumella sp. UCD-D_suzukii]|uniref:DUF6024 family protein n=1 Tax=Tatumella sp. UCD-D_suzukii TaxID=1408192 RepID=UPI00046EC252|nr:DUF6024 family protein [Tatumella sp. UCD-D_suzukii]
MNSELDDSAINASLFPSDSSYCTHYFRALGHCRNEIKKRLRMALSIPHEDIFLLSNSTHCLLTVLHGLSAQSRTLSIEAGCYHPYRMLPQPSYGQSVPLITHISPDSGNVACIHQKAVVVDAAQSIGVVCHHSEAFSADVVFFPLHKHLALLTGVGVLCVRKRYEYETVRKTAQIAESGTVNNVVLQALLERLTTKPLLFNIAMFSLTPAQAESLTMLGFEPVTQLYSQTPFLVVKTSSGHLLPEYLVNNFSLKMLDANHWRISCYIPGTLDSPPKECASLLINVLRSKL